MTLAAFMPAALRAGRALREAHRGVRHHHLAARGVRLAPAARADVLRRPRHGPRLPVRAGGHRRVPRAAGRGRARSASGCCRRSRCCSSRCRPAGSSRSRCSWRSSTASSAGHGGAKPRPRRRRGAWLGGAARGAGRRAGRSRSPLAAALAPAAARAPRRRVIARARVLAPDHVRVELAAPLARPDAGELPLHRARARPTCRSPITRGEARGATARVLLDARPAARPGRPLPRSRSRDPPLARDVRPPPWALLLTVVLSSALINNFVFTRYLGLCIFFGVSQEARHRDRHGHHVHRRHDAARRCCRGRCSPAC